MEKRKALIWILWRGPSEQRVLLLKRSAADGAHWQPVTGNLETGEDFAAAALRESQEETGFHFSRHPQYLGLEHHFVGRWGAAVERAFVLIVNGDTPPLPKLDPKEHEEFEWVSVEEAHKRLPYDHQKEALYRASQFKPLMLSKAGTWYQDGEEITHARTVQLLHKNLRCGPDGQYRVEIDDETIDVICEDVARFVRHIDLQTGTITLMDGRKESLNPATCFVGNDNIFYCTLGSGERAKFLSSAYYEITRAITELSDATGRRQYFLHFRGRDYEILVP